MNKKREEMIRAAEKKVRLKENKEFYKVEKDNKKIGFPCPHGRMPIGGSDGWKHCPWCLGLNNIIK